MATFADSGVNGAPGARRGGQAGCLAFLLPLKPKPLQPLGLGLGPLLPGAPLITQEQVRSHPETTAPRMSHKGPTWPGTTMPGCSSRGCGRRTTWRARAPQVQPCARSGRALLEREPDEEATALSVPPLPRSGFSDKHSQESACVNHEATSDTDTLTSMSSLTCSCWSLSSPKASIIKPGVKRR